MRRSKTLVWLLVPAAIGLLLGGALETGLLPYELFVLRLQVSLGVLAIAIGIAVSGIFVAGWEVTRRWRRAVQQAAIREREAQTEAHRRFIRRLDHELKNPLMAMGAALANVDRERDVSPSARASICNLRNQVERLGRLAGDLRKLADLDAGIVEQEMVDLAEVVAEAVDATRAVPGHADRRVAVTVQKVPWPPGPVLGDRDLLLLGVYNLLDNALKFSPNDATVEVRVSEDGARISVEVADDGPGIPPEDLPHLTEELYRGQATRGIEGSGLGLALVERIAMLHRGDLAIRSRVGQGTVAALRLPLGRR